MHSAGAGIDSAAMGSAVILRYLRRLLGWATGTAAGAATRPGRKKDSRRLALALQGGGAHGAFTWGVLDRLLENNSRTIDAISGTSAGAINAAIFAAGYLDGGATGARDRLMRFWHKLADLARLNPMQPTPFEIMALGRNIELSFAHVLRDVMVQMFSPYQLNPLDLNPLRDLLVRFIDFERLKQDDAPRLFIAATNVETGEARIFSNAELSPEVLLASACLPALHQAVRLPDGYYWDGGFTANPPLLALIEGSVAEDILIVRLNPKSEKSLPLTAPGIQARVNRIVFDGPLRRELETVERLRQMAQEAGAARSAFGRRLASLTLHTISEDEVMTELGAASKLNPNWELVRYLRDVGRAACARWLAEVAPSAATAKSQAPLLLTREFELGGRAAIA